MSAVIGVIELGAVVIAGICGFQGNSAGAAQFWACACYLHLQRRGRTDASRP